MLLSLPQAVNAAIASTDAEGDEHLAKAGHTTDAYLLIVSAENYLAAVDARKSQATGS